MPVKTKSQSAMKPAIQFSLLLIVLQVHNGHGDKDPLQEKLAASIADFAFKFSRQVASLQSGKNIFFSPLSISMAFSMIGMGAKSNTQNQIYKGLGLTSIDTSKIHKEFEQLIQRLNHPGAKMDIGNALWIKKSHQILPKVSEGVKSLYKTESFNFQQSSVAEKQINDYVKKKTHGKITKAVQGLDAAAIMVLVNYIYFKGMKFICPFQNSQCLHPIISTMCFLGWALLMCSAARLIYLESLEVAA